MRQCFEVEYYNFSHVECHCMLINYANQLMQKQISCKYQVDILVIWLQYCNDYISIIICKITHFPIIYFKDKDSKCTQACVALFTQFSKHTFQPNCLTSVKLHLAEDNFVGNMTGFFYMFLNCLLKSTQGILFSSTFIV